MVATRRIVVFALVASLSACHSPAVDPSLAAEPAEDVPIIRPGLGQAIYDSVVTVATSGCSGTTLVALNDSIVLFVGFGAIRAKTPYKEAVDSRHWLASVTKQFAAAAILRLEEAKRLSVTDSIGKLLPRVPPDKRSITIHQLLTHTSGLPSAYAADSIRQRSTAIQRVLNLQMDHAPGTGFLYSDDNYTLIAAIIEIASGSSYEEYLRTRLFEPANMHSTGFWGSPASAAVAPTSQPIPVNQLGAHWGQRGSGGVFSTVRDLYRWVRALNHGQVLTESSRSRLVGQFVRTSAGMYGYGWFTSETARKTPMLWTRGNEDWGPNALIALYPREALTVITLSHAFTGKGPGCSRLIPPIAEYLYSIRN